MALVEKNVQSVDPLSGDSDRDRTDGHFGSCSSPLHKFGSLSGNSLLET